MKTFDDYKDEIYTCSRCGLCQSVCPVFEVTKKETTVSRGFFSLLNGITKGHLKFNKKIRYNIDKCLGCNKCKAFCPSGIDTEKIISSAKISSFDYAPLWKKLALRGLYSKTFLRIAGLVRIYRVFPVLDFTSFGKVLHKFLTPNVRGKKNRHPEFISGSHRLGMQVKSYFGKMLSSVQNDVKEENLNSVSKVVIFPGCINNYFNPSSLNAIKTLLHKNGITSAIPDFDCCTMPAHSIGDITNFKKFAIKNLNKIPNDTDFVLFDCASCKKAFELYTEVLEGDEKKKAEDVFAKCKHINEFLLEQSFDLPVLDEKIDYHAPCHLDCADKTFELMTKTGLDVTLLPERCCGSAGLFFIENYAISNELAKKKILEAKSDTILTDCPLCRLGLIKGSVLSNYDIRVTSLVEMLAQKL